MEYHFMVAAARKALKRKLKELWKMAEGMSHQIQKLKHKIKKEKRRKSGLNFDFDVEPQNAFTLKGVDARIPLPEELKGFVWSNKSVRNREIVEIVVIGKTDSESRFPNCYVAYAQHRGEMRILLLPENLVEFPQGTRLIVTPRK
jgi:hypothetical protein